MSLLSQIGYSGVRATQVALNITGQNVANVNTPGFSRLGVQLSSLGGHTAMSSGRGVQVDNVRRIVDDFVTHQLWRATSHQSYTEGRQKYVRALETLMASEGANISGGLDNLYAALSEATSTPDSIALRQQVLNEARNLAQRVNGLSNNIETQLNGLRGQREAIVVELNGLTANLATLNQRITHVEASNGDAKALRDQRDSLIQDLAELADIRILEATDGSFSVSLANGQPLVSGPTAATVTLTTGVDKVQTFALTFAGGPPLNLGHEVGWGGQLGALYEAEYGGLRATQGTISEIGEKIADLFNNVLTSGFDVNGVAGKALFAYDPTSISQVLTVTDLTPAELGFSSVDPAGDPNLNEPGNNDKLRELLALKNQKVTLTIGGVSSDVTLNDAYATLLGGIASESRQGEADVETATSVLKQAQSQRDSISAVNLDEEGVNLMNYQQAYQANLKVITTAGALFDSVLGMF